MGRLRFVTPEIVRLPLSEGDWIEVKRRLTVGESRAAVTSFVGKYNTDGSRTPNHETLGMGQVLAYLVAWSFHDAEDRPVPVTLDAIKMLELGSYVEIENAIETHTAAVEAEEQAREKKTPANGAPAVSAIS